MEDKFRELATAAREAETYRAECEAKFDRARKWLEGAARHASNTKGALRGFVEAEAGIRIS